MSNSYVIELNRYYSTDILLNDFIKKTIFSKNGHPNNKFKKFEKMKIKKKM